jgi:hypothetical protein
MISCDVTTVTRMLLEEDFCLLQTILTNHLWLSPRLTLFQEEGASDSNFAVFQQLGAEDEGILQQRQFYDQFQEGGDTLLQQLSAAAYIIRSNRRR